MPGDNDHEQKGEPVMDEGGARPPSERERPVPAQKQPAGQHHQPTSSREGSVEFLAGVELTDREGPGMAAALLLLEHDPQPFPVCRGPSVEAPDVAPEGLTPGPRQSEDERHGEGDAGIEVYSFHQLAAAHESNQGRQVKSGASEDEHRKKDGIRPVDGPLDPVEAGQQATAITSRRRHSPRRIGAGA